MYQQGDHMAVLVAALHDIAADPARWHGFRIWVVEDAWWAELHRHLGENQDYPHLTYLPDGYGKDQRTWPVILFLHGSGERGTDLKTVMKWGPATYAKSGHPLPFIIITPQCPDDDWWDPARLMRLLDEVAATYRVDPKRIYVTGLSMGGYGTLDLAATYPDKFAAIAPLSGGEDPDLADRLKTVPAWFFHGDDDRTVPTRYSTDLVAALQKLGAPVKLTVYPGVGHGGWDKTYGDPNLYA
jgi:predicted peptidase